jgi:hypothetical protein
LRLLREPRALSVGTLGNTQIDMEASASFPWCDSLYLKPHVGARVQASEEEAERAQVDFGRYEAILIWHQNPEYGPLRVFFKRALHENPGLLVIGNSHGYNKSVSELFDIYGLRLPQCHLDYYSMWGCYFTDRYRAIYGRDPFARGLVALGSLRHDYLYRKHRWNRDRTNGKVLVVHEPMTSESWDDQSPIGDNRVTESILESLDKHGIAFDFKVHPNWPDFRSNSDRPMWRPPGNVNVVNIPIAEMLRYEAVIASWSSSQFEAMAMGIPVINIEYLYPTISHSEWGPGRYGLLKPIKPDLIPTALDKRDPAKDVDFRLLCYFLGDLGRVDETYFGFIRAHTDLRSHVGRLLKRGPIHRLHTLRAKVPALKARVRRFLG